jgi:hypothetical protein
VRILAQTNYYPSLIQLYCSQLLKQIQNLQTSTVDFSTGPRYAITEREVDDVYRSRDLREAIRSRIQLTLQLDPRYELIAYTIAYGVLQRTVPLQKGWSRARYGNVRSDGGRKDSRELATMNFW